MISFKTPMERGASIASICAVIVLAATFAFTLFVPKPAPDRSAKATRDNERKLRLAIKEAEEKVATSNQLLATYLWSEGAAQVGPAALAKVNDIVRKHGVRLVAFRPQRATQIEGLTQLPFILSLDGPFPAVSKVVRELEQPQTRLAVNLLQVSAAEGAADQVTATVGTVAYIRTETTPRPAASPAPATAPARTITPKEAPRNG